MSEPSRVATLAEQEEMKAAARTYMGAILVMARRQYGEVFDTWPEDVQHSCAITMALQGMLTADAFGAVQINLDFAAYGVGLAVGTNTGGVHDQGMPVIVARLLDGLATGRAQATVARDSFKTTGSAN